MFKILANIIQAISYLIFTKHKDILLGIYSLLLLYTPTLTAETHAQTLQRVQTEITSLVQQVIGNRERYQNLQTSLQTTENSIADLAQSLQILNDVLPQKQRNLEQLSIKWHKRKIQVKQEQVYLSEQIRAAYMMGRQDYLKILLNQEDPTMIGRVLTYYDYFNRARAQQIKQYQQHIQQLEKLKDNVEAETQEVNRLLQETQIQKQQLQESYAMRQLVLLALSETIENQDLKLYNLEADKTELQQLLGKIPIQILKSRPRQRFSSLKKRLPQPVLGKIIHQFNEDRGIGKLKWQGLFFEAKTGTVVHSVADGEVVFADWFHNLGYLLIIKHDAQYMSLYGHNRNLYKKIGDSVLQGDVISQVGNSGGKTQTGLYFELRKQGKTVNPTNWLVN